MSKTVVIYTCIVGNYDVLLQPIVVDDRFDYICFINKGAKISSNTGIWKLREIPFENIDNRVLSRYVKINVHKVLQEYEYSLYIDGNISIAHKDFYEIIFNKIKDGIKYSGIYHWGRDCAYDEAFAVLNSRKDSLSRIIKSVRYLKRNGFPRHYGMYENNVILRKHSDKQIISFNEIWWNYYLQFSKRDQIFHSYCLMRSHLDFNYLLPRGYSARNHYSLYYKKHDIIDKKITMANAIFRKSSVLLAKLLTVL